MKYVSPFTHCDLAIRIEFNKDSDKISDLENTKAKSGKGNGKKSRKII